MEQSAYRGATAWPKAWVWGGKWHIYNGSVGQPASDKAMNPRWSPDSAFYWLYYLGQAI